MVRCSPGLRFQPVKPSIPQYIKRKKKAVATVADGFGGGGGGRQRRRTDGCYGGRLRRTKMRRDGLARGLEVEAALAAEAAWELWDAVASMDGFHMDADSTLDLPIELGGDGSLSVTEPPNENSN